MSVESNAWKAQVGIVSRTCTVVERTTTMQPASEHTGAPTDFPRPDVGDGDAADAGTWTFVHLFYDDDTCWYLWERRRPCVCAEQNLHTVAESESEKQKANTMKSESAERHECKYCSWYNKELIQCDACKLRDVVCEKDGEIARLQTELRVGAIKMERPRYLVVNLDKHQATPHFRTVLDSIELRDCDDGNTMIVDLDERRRYYTGSWDAVEVLESRTATLDNVALYRSALEVIDAIEDESGDLEGLSKRTYDAFAALRSIVKGSK